MSWLDSMWIWFFIFAVAWCCCPLQCNVVVVKGAMGRAWITRNLLHQPPTRPTGPRCSFCSAFAGLNTNKIANYLHWGKCNSFIDFYSADKVARGLQLWKQLVLFIDLYSYEPVEKFLFALRYNRDSIYVLQGTCMKCPGRPSWRIYGFTPGSTLPLLSQHKRERHTHCSSQPWILITDNLVIPMLID